MAHDFNAMFGAETAESREAAEHAEGFAVASVACLDLGAKIREAYPDQSPAFYRGLIDGIREELC